MAFSFWKSQRCLWRLIRSPVWLFSFYFFFCFLVLLPALCVSPPPPPSVLSLQLCRSDVWYVNGPWVLSNGPGLVFDTLTPPIDTVSHRHSLRLPPGRSLEDVSTAYWNFFDAGFVLREGKHDTGLATRSSSVMSVWVFFLSSFFSHHGNNFLIIFSCISPSILLEAADYGTGRNCLLSWVFFGGRCSDQWNVKRCNGFQHWTSLLFTVASPVWLHYAPRHQQPRPQGLINHS